MRYYKYMHSLEKYELLKKYFAWTEDNSFSFIERLSRENNWSTNFARRALHEYIKFVYLCNVSKVPMTPSDEVDQVWHLHLQYCEKYNEMNTLLGKPLIHGPTKGGQAEDTKFKNWYAITKEFYKENFKKDPPDDLWPDDYQRFEVAPTAIRLVTKEHFIIKKKTVYTGLTIFVIMTLGALWLNLH